MLPGALTRHAERGHRSLPIGVEAVPPFVCPRNVYGVVVLVSEGEGSGEVLLEILLVFGVLWIAP